MNISFGLRQDSDGVLWFDKAPKPPRRVLTVAAACRRLRRTRRQVYRLMKAGRLGPPEKMLGGWLLDQSAVESLAQAPLTAQPLPARLKPLLPEYDPKALNAGKDGVLIISRVLEGGGREDLRWLLKRYPRREIRRVVEEEGSRLLSARSRRLWSLVFKVTPRPLASWRRSDPWRGASS
ncbi:MAG: helix-turn-helix domain-containing protein [Elusimicrobiota bacterium]